jgi:hypothetical protein
MTDYDNKPFLVAAMEGSYNNTTGQLILKGQKIVSGKIENLKVWEVTLDSSRNVTKVADYEGSASSVTFYGYAINTDTYTYNYQTGKGGDNIYGYGSATISFTNGSGSGVVNNN